MRFVERILGKINHRVVDAVRMLLTDTFRNAAGNALLRIAVYEIPALLLHDRLLLLTHGAAHQIRPAHRISAEIADDLH